MASRPQKRLKRRPPSRVYLRWPEARSSQRPKLVEAPAALTLHSALSIELGENALPANFAIGHLRFAIFSARLPLNILHSSFRTLH